MKLTDTKKTVEISMCVWQDGSGYTPDWSEDFFNAGNLPYDEDREAYIVADVDHCVDQANDWAHSTGDFAMDDPDSNRTVFVEEIEEGKAKVYGNEPTNLKLSDLAFEVYSNTDPLTIVEETDGTYSMHGCFEQTGMTAEEVNSFLEELGSEEDTF